MAQSEKPIAMSCPLPTSGETPMRQLTLIYHEIFEDDITRVVGQQMGVARYTKIRDVVGARRDAAAEGDYEPMHQNHLLILVADCGTVQAITAALKELRQKQGHGLRGYITPVEDVI
jgi:hypothetical protein